MNRIDILRRACALGLALVPGLAAAQAGDFPNSRVTMIVPFTAGGPTDVVARLIAPPLQEKWKQPVIVENRPGGGTVLGTEAAARAKPDGYTILLHADISTLPIFTKLNFEPMKDLRPVSKLMVQYFVVMTTPQVPAKNLAEFIAYAKQRPKVLNYATIPYTQYDIEYPIFFEKAGGLSLTAIPYNGAAPITNALLNNDVQLYFGSVTAFSSHIASGKLTALAITGPRRIEQLPGVPSIRESGVDYESSTFYALYAPTQTPDAIVAKIAADASQAVKVPEVTARLKQFGYEILGGTPAQATQEINAQARAFEEAARKMNIKPQ